VELLASQVLIEQRKGSTRNRTMAILTKIDRRQQKRQIGHDPISQDQISQDQISHDQVRRELTVGAETVAALILAAIVIAGVALAIPECQVDRDRCSVLTVAATLR
jgi:ribosome biogenesis SPOUT family RNA methylase Rps3